MKSSLWNAIAEDFKSPPVLFRSKPFWAWNAGLEEQELRRQIGIFKEMGFGGAFLHSRVGLATEYLGKEWFDLTKACIDESKKQGLEAWLYDEDRWPSGPAGGIVTKNMDYRMRLLSMQRFAEFEQATLHNKSLQCWWYAIEFEGDRMLSYRRLREPASKDSVRENEEFVIFGVTYWPDQSWFNGQGYLDTMDQEAVREFIRVTHEQYRVEVGEHFGGVIPGMFTDEPNHGSTFQSCLTSAETTPWTRFMTEKFKAMFSYDLVDYLPEVYFGFADERYSQPRLHYHRCLTRLFVESFSKQIAQWCQDNNLLFTGHVLEEVPIGSNVGIAGSAMQFYQYMQAPGIDNLTQYWDHYLAAKQCTSVARQMGRKWVLSELYGCTGWETTFETYKYVGDWQACLGITLRCPHLSLYSMAGEAKRDYPASIHFHSPWWKEYRQIENYFSRLNVLLTRGEPVCDLAVIHPLDSFALMLQTDQRPSMGGELFDCRNTLALKEMDRLYDSFVSDLLFHHLDFDFVDEFMMQDLPARVVQEGETAFLQVGQMKYRAVLVPSLKTIRPSTVALLKEFAAAGGKLVFAGQVPEHIDAVKDDRALELAAGRTVPLAINEIESVLSSEVRRLNIRSQDGSELTKVLYQLRRVEQGYVLFMVNTDRENAYQNVTVSLQCEEDDNIQQVQWLDTLEASRCGLPSNKQNHLIEFEVDFEASGSALLVLSEISEEIPEKQSSPKLNDIAVQMNGSWDYTLDEPNVLVLDTPDCEVHSKEYGDRSFQSVEIIELDRELRNWLNIPHRGGDMIQPWAQKGQPLGPTAQLKLEYSFEVDILPQGPVSLVIEQPSRWEILLNGTKLSNKDTGKWWVDPALRIIELPSGSLKTGKNALTVTGRFDCHTDLEIIYLLGSFGVQVNEGAGSITKMPDKLTLDDWCTQGLAFYCGNVDYSKSFTLAMDHQTKYYLRLGKHNATAVQVSVNQSEPIVMSHGSYAVEITNSVKDGQNHLSLRLMGSRRNGFGPLHWAEDKPKFIGPNSFRRDPDAWQDDYKLVPYGMFAPVEIYKVSSS